MILWQYKVMPGSPKSRRMAQKPDLQCEGRALLCVSYEYFVSVKWKQFLYVLMDWCDPAVIQSQRFFYRRFTHIFKNVVTLELTAWYMFNCRYMPGTGGVLILFRITPRISQEGTSKLRLPKVGDCWGCDRYPIVHCCIYEKVRKEVQGPVLVC